MLSVILAMLVVLLGRMAVEQFPSTPEPEAIIRTGDTSLVLLPPAVLDDDQPEPEPLGPEPVSREERFSELVEQRFQGEVTAVPRDHGVSIEIPDVVLFESARAELQDSAQLMLTRLALTLRETGEADIAVEGHTDNRPVHGGEFSSNWELAAARANAVTRFLPARGLAAHRLRAVSYGDTRPISDNNSVDGQAANRRVELRVEFLASAETNEAVGVETQRSSQERSEYSL